MIRAATAWWEDRFPHEAKRRGLPTREEDPEEEEKKQQQEVEVEVEVEVEERE